MYLLLLSVLSLTIPSTQDRPVLDPTQLAIPFQRYTTTDALGRTITFYLSRATENKPDQKLPIVVWIQGSGCQSLFQKRGDKITGGLQNLLLQEARGRVRVLAVEKPGVKFCDAPPRPGTAEGASEEFLREHTLPRWAEANVAAIKAAWKLPEVNAARSLAMGHSEGGIVAARVTAELPGVTHVSSLAGGGPTQLFSLADMAGRPRPGDGPHDASQRIQKIYDDWAKIQADPDSTTRMWMAHPYRRWSTFLTHSVTAELLRSKAKIYLAQGTLDTASSVAGFDVLRAELVVRGRDVTAERIDGADHGFRPKDAPQGPPKEMEALLGRILEWFLRN